MNTIHAVLYLHVPDWNVKHVGMQLFYAMCCTFVCLHFSSSLAICASLFCFYFCSNFNFKTLNSQLAQFTSLAQWSKLHFICQFLLDNWHKHLHHTHNAHKYLFLYHVNYKTEIENENRMFVSVAMHQRSMERSSYLSFHWYFMPHRITRFPCSMIWSVRSIETHTQVQYISFYLYACLFTIIIIINIIIMIAIVVNSIVQMIKM